MISENRCSAYPDCSSTVFLGELRLCATKHGPLFANGDSNEGLAWLKYYNQSNARALIGQSAVVYCGGKRMEKSRVF